MKPYISQPRASMYCGAYSIAYYLWETNKTQHINDRAFVENINVIDKVKSGANKYAIIMCGSEKSAKALHYILIKYEDNTLKILNSSAYYGNGTDNVTWENFTIKSNGKLILERYTPYLYTGSGILIK